MERVTILFPSLRSLQEFVTITGNKEHQISKSGNTVTASFSDAEVELAINGMRGVLNPSRYEEQ